MVRSDEARIMGRKGNNDNKLRPDSEGALAWRRDQPVPRRG